MFSYSTSALFVLAASAAILASVVVAVFFYWGRLMGRAGLRSRSTKWKTYTFTLVPMAVLAISCLNHQDLQPMAWKMFFTLSCPAMLGVFHRWHWGSSDIY